MLWHCRKAVLLILVSAPLSKVAVHNKASRMEYIFPLVFISVQRPIVYLNCFVGFSRLTEINHCNLKTTEPLIKSEVIIPFKILLRVLTTTKLLCLFHIKFESIQSYKSLLSAWIWKTFKKCCFEILTALSSMLPPIRNSMVLPVMKTPSFPRTIARPSTFMFRSLVALLVIWECK